MFSTASISCWYWEQRARETAEKSCITWDFFVFCSISRIKNNVLSAYFQRILLVLLFPEIVKQWNSDVDLCYRIDVIFTTNYSTNSKREVFKIHKFRLFLGIWLEIWTTTKLNRWCNFQPYFWFYLLPGWKESQRIPAWSELHNNTNLISTIKLIFILLLRWADLIFELAKQFCLVVRVMCVLFRCCSFVPPRTPTLIQQ